jgi:hypothetical protein
VPQRLASSVARHATFLVWWKTEFCFGPWPDGAARAQLGKARMLSLQLIYFDLAASSSTSRNK